MKAKNTASDCPINFALETLGNRWAFLIIRDIVFYGKKTYGEFLSSQEGIATSMLADRLASLEKEGIIAKQRSEIDRRKEIYSLAENGYSLIPVILDLGSWGMQRNGTATNNPAWIEQLTMHRPSLLQLITTTLQEGGSIFNGDNNVLQKLGIEWKF